MNSLKFKNKHIHISPVRQKSKSEGLLSKAEFFGILWHYDVKYIQYTQTDPTIIILHFVDDWEPLGYYLMKEADFIEFQRDPTYGFEV